MLVAVKGLSAVDQLRVGILGCLQELRSELEAVLAKLVVEAIQEGVCFIAVKDLRVAVDHRLQQVKRGLNLLLLHQGVCLVQFGPTDVLGAVDDAEIKNYGLHFFDLGFKVRALLDSIGTVVLKLDLLEDARNLKDAPLWIFIGVVSGSV